MPTKKQDSFAASASDSRLKTPIRPSDTVSVAWECAHCGKRELFRFGAECVDRPPLVWKCGRAWCGNWTRADLRQIGRDAYAACWVR